MTSRNPAPTEVDSYIYIKERLKDLGWDTRNPEHAPGGQVYNSERVPLKS